MYSLFVWVQQLISCYSAFLDSSTQIIFSLNNTIICHLNLGNTQYLMQFIPINWTFRRKLSKIVQSNFEWKPNLLQHHFVMMKYTNSIYFFQLQQQLPYKSNQNHGKLLQSHWTNWLGPCISWQCCKFSTLQWFVLRSYQCWCNSIIEFSSVTNLE